MKWKIQERFKLGMFDVLTSVLLTQIRFINSLLFHIHEKEEIKSRTIGHVMRNFCLKPSAVLKLIG